ncbi:MAG: peptidase M23 [Actinobacteria bacterium]|nr:MAG: peptidase M23 [Actinomycetota bacterium]
MVLELLRKGSSLAQETSVSSPFPSRRELHGSGSSQQQHTHEEEFHLPSSRPSGSRHVLRTVVLAFLALTTLVVPIAGFIGPDSSLSLPMKALSGGIASSTWVAGTDGNIAEANLEGSVAAASRARIRTPLLATACVPAATAADGAREVVQQESVYWPLEPGTYEVTSGFSMRISPVSGQLLMHEGVDLAAPLGTPIYSAAQGTVKEVSQNSHSGAYIIIEHKAADGTPYYSAYLHQYMKDIVVAVGDTIQAGQRIGAVGNNGWSTGAHLHFEIHNSSKTPIDPVPFMEEIGATFIGQECQ